MNLPPFPSSIRRACFLLCAVLFLSIFARPPFVSAQTKNSPPPDTSRAAAIDAANARAVDLFRALSEAKSDNAREQAISALHAMARSRAPEDHEAIAHYGMTAFMTSSDEKKQAEYTEHRAILAKVIPLMYGTLTGDVQDKAWWVLINVQDAPFPPKRALWEQWWKNKGKALFAPAEASPPVPVATPVPDEPKPPVPKARPVPDKAKQTPKAASKAKK
jgi:hypothetical protein